MVHDLLVIHRPRRSKAEGSTVVSGELVLPSPWINWQTCLRHISIGLENWFDGEVDISADEVYEGQDAYRFLLEVICGLHCPIVGETEVLGQFHKLFAELELSGYFNTTPMRGVFEHLFEDVKEIRSNCLTNLGSQTYGSVARSLLQGIKSVSIIGSGQLAEEILPWLFKEDRIVNLFYRSITPARRLQNEHPKLMIYDLYNSPSLPIGDAVIVAAPVDNMLVRELVSTHGENQLKVLLDLRAKGEADALCLAEKELALEDFFGVLRKTQLQVANKVKHSKRMIDDRVIARASEIILRPFGWEDAWR